MCSNMWANPRRFGFSSFAPTEYQTRIEATGAESSANVTTRIPLSRVIT
jgi:hypothetical protein